MSELKAFELKVGKNLETDSPLIVGVDNKLNSRIMSCEEVYLKSEADRVIAHHKYKRCLAMANSCSDKASAEYAASYVSCDEYYYHHAEFWEKWRKRWLELAEQFKEAK